MYAFGSNIFGQIKYSENAEEYYTEPVTVKETLPPNKTLFYLTNHKPGNEMLSLLKSKSPRKTLKIKQVIVDWSSFIYLTDCGELYPHGDASKLSFPGDEFINACSCNKDVLTLISKGGKCYVSHNKDAGDASFHTVQKAKSENNEEQSQADSPPVFSGVDASDTRIVGTTREGAVGHILHQPMSDSTPTSIFQPIECRLPVAQVACGNDHTVLLSKFGDVLVMGCSSRGQLGDGSIDVSIINTPQVVTSLAGVNITDVKAGGWHTLALSDIGDVYAWGWNESGQLAMPCEDSDDQSKVMVQPYPTLIELPGDDDVTVTHIACGSRHSVAVTSTGQLYTWGCNHYGQLGTGDTRNRDRPTHIDYFTNRNLKVLTAFAGGWNTVAMVDRDYTPGPE